MALEVLPRRWLPGEARSRIAAAAPPTLPGEAHASAPKPPAPPVIAVSSLSATRLRVEPSSRIPDAAPPDPGRPLPQPASAPPAPPVMRCTVLLRTVESVVSMSRMPTPSPPPCLAAPGTPV